MNVSLVLFRKSGIQRSFRLPSSVTVIGRRADCDLHAPLMSVSKRHCQLTCNEGRLRIRDLGSRNGTYVNGQRIEEAEVKAGDRVKVGPLIFLLQIDGQPESIERPRAKAAAKSRPEGAPEDDLIDKMLDEFDNLDDLEPLDDDASQ